MSNELVLLVELPLGLFCQYLAEGMHKQAAPVDNCISFSCRSQQRTVTPPDEAGVGKRLHKIHFLCRWIPCAGFFLKEKVYLLVQCEVLGAKEKKVTERIANTQHSARHLACSSQSFWKSFGVKLKKMCLFSFSDSDKSAESSDSSEYRTDFQRVYHGRISEDARSGTEVEFEPNNPIRTRDKSDFSGGKYFSSQISLSLFWSRFVFDCFWVDPFRPVQEQGVLPEQEANWWFHAWFDKPCLRSVPESIDLTSQKHQSRIYTWLLCWKQKPSRVSVLAVQSVHCD